MHLAENVTIGIVPECDGDASNLEVKDYSAAACGLVIRALDAIANHQGRTESRVPGKRQLLIRGENANLRTPCILHGQVPWKDESGFLEIGFARDSLHLEVAETTRIREDGKRIAL